MLVHFGIKPYLVFDGDYLPSKSGTEKERATRRRDSRKNGLELLRLGKTSQAHLELQKSIDVTPEMARQLIEELKKASVDYVVAPYEADSQMVYLEKKGVIDAILSEDSDLLVFGAQCLLTKLDQYGECIMINRKDFTACREISLVGWSDAEFRLMAILSGCDYLSGIPNMGLKTAYRLIRKHKTVERLIRAVQFDGKIKVPPGYLDAFKKAEATFLYQWVYCGEAKGLVNFSEPAAGVDLADFPCIGKFVEQKHANGVATGHLHPHTKEPIILPLHVSRAPLRTSASFSTPDLKKHKPIESFFRSGRTPLAELDPNSFTPSPSQRQLLERSPASWSAEPIARRQPLVRESSFAPSSAPQRLRRAVTDMRPPPPSQSPKRQRLCSDGFYAVPMAKAGRVESGPSKFFASKSSPSLSRKKSGERSAANEFNLWSDDSVEEAMSQIPEHDMKIKASTSKKLPVFKDGTAKRSSDSTEDPSPTASADQSTPSNAEQSQEPCAPLGETPFTSGLTASVDLLRFKYSSTKMTQEKTNKPPKRRHTEGSSVPDSHNNLPIPCSPPTTSPDTKEMPTDDHFDDADWNAAESRLLSTLSGQSQSLRSRKPVKAEEATVKGSEDLIVPDSEGEGDEEEEFGAKSTAGFRFDIGRFAFAG